MQPFFPPHIYLWGYFHISVYESHTMGKLCPTLSVKCCTKVKYALIIPAGPVQLVCSIFPLSKKTDNHKYMWRHWDNNGQNIITKVQNLRNTRWAHFILTWVREGFCPVSTSCLPPSQKQGVTLPELCAESLSWVLSKHCRVVCPDYETGKRVLEKNTFLLGHTSNVVFRAPASHRKDLFLFCFKLSWGVLHSDTLQL